MCSLRFQASILASRTCLHISSCSRYCNCNTISNSARRVRSASLRGEEDRRVVLAPTSEKRPTLTSSGSCLAPDHQHHLFSFSEAAKLKRV